MTTTFQAQQALRLRHLHALQQAQAQAQANDAADRGRYGDCVFRVPTSPPPPPPPRTGRLPGQRPAEAADRAGGFDAGPDRSAGEGSGKTSGEEKFDAQGMRIRDITSDSGAGTGGDGGHPSDQGAGSGGESGGGSSGGDGRPDQPWRAALAQAEPSATEPDEAAAIDSRGGERASHRLRHAHARSHARAQASAAARVTRASGRRPSSGVADNLSGGRDLEHDIECGFLSTKDLEVKAILEATRVAAVDPDAKGKHSGGRHASDSAPEARGGSKQALQGAAGRSTTLASSLSARSLDTQRRDMRSCLQDSPELARLHQAILAAGTPQAREQALAHALFVLSAARIRPGRISADAAQLVVMAAYLDAAQEPGPLSKRQGVKEALLMQGPPAASVLPPSAAVRDRMALLPLKLLVCHQRRTDGQRQVAAARMLGGMDWPVSPRGARRES
jgi:hypothetical protein